MKNMKKLAIPVVIVLVALIAIISFVSYKNSEIDLMEYIEIESVNGLNGQGVLQYRLDTRALSQVLFGEISDEEVTEENFEAVMAQNFAKYDEIDKAIDCITLSADKDTGLSNGDKVTVTASFQDTSNYDFSYHFKDASIEYTVSGLREGKVLDAFADGVMLVSFDGFNGAGTASVNIQATDEIHSYLRYDVAPYMDLSNGDTVTVSVSYNAEKLEELGYFYPEVTEVSYPVEGLAEYLTLDDGIPAAALEGLKQMLMDQMQAEANEDLNEFHILSKAPEIMGTYFVSTDDPAVICHNYWYGLDIQNAIVVVGHYTIDYTGYFPTVFEEWSALVFPNCYLDDNGNLMYEENVTDMNLSFESKDDFAPWFQEAFLGMSVTELGVLG